MSDETALSHPSDTPGPHESLLTGRRRSRRTLLDNSLRYLVTFGGSTVLAAIVLIFIYLLWTVAPAFAPASITDNGQIALPERTARLLDFNEAGDVLMRIAADGITEFVDVHSGKPLIAYDLGFPIEQAQRVYPTLDIYAVLDANQRLWLVRTSYEVNIAAGIRSVTPQLEAAFSNQFISLGSTDTFDVHLANDSLVIASMSGTQMSLLRYDNAELGLPLLNAAQASLSVDNSIEKTVLGPRNEWVYLLDDSNSLHIYDITQPNRMRELFHTQLAAATRKLTATVALLGRQSILAADDRGVLTQWTVVRDDLGFRMQPIRHFDLGSAVHTLVSEPRRKGLLAGTQDGNLHLIYPTSGKTQTRYAADQREPRVNAVSPRADQFVTADNNRLHLFELDNPHPELSLSALWSEVWYEGYSEPVYSWQSSAADNDFEPKFSLVPLVFGTLKAAFYALLFALPLAIMGAIYTAHFMPAHVRAWIKPGIEVMAALPTVILGFIGGLWLAPIVEQELASVLSAFVLVPCALIVCAVLWSMLSATQRENIVGGYALLVVPAIIAAIWLGFQIGPWFEQAWFGGDSRTWLREVAGLDYAQRNALVVGMMMGLAVIPPIFSIAEDAIHGVPQHLVNGSLALGATPWQTLSQVVLLTAAPGIFSAIMVGVGRAVGETMIVLMATGNTPIMDFNVFEGMRTFAANIAVELPETEVNSSHYRILFLTAFVLFMITFFFNTLAEVVRERLRSHYGNL
ncbi:MAG: ABC transporter permease subunit [bacterium]